MADDLQRLAADADLASFNRKALKADMDPDGRFRAALPRKWRQIAVLARHTLSAFEPDVHYTKRPVNDLVVRFTDDTTTIQRTLVDLGLLELTAKEAASWRADAG